MMGRTIPVAEMKNPTMREMTQEPSEYGKILAHSQQYYQG